MDKVMVVNEVRKVRSLMSVRLNDSGQRCQCGQMSQVKDFSEVKWIRSCMTIRSNGSG